MRSILAILLFLVVLPSFPRQLHAHVSCSVETLLRMTPAQLEALYRQSPATAIPLGEVRGTALLRPGARGAVRRARLASLAWQGKIFRDDATVINRFFGLRHQGPGLPWFQPARRRPEPDPRLPRHISPLCPVPRRDPPGRAGLWLGLMYERGNPRPVLMFALNTR